MFAALPMYLTEANRPAHDAFWARLRAELDARGIGAPERLDHDTPPMEGWARPDLVLGQICNLPYRAHFRDQLTRIGASDYGVPGEAPGYYHSVFVVRDDDPAQGFAECDGYSVAFNEPLSQSGWANLSASARDAGLRLTPVLQTGSHRGSMAAVTAGRADLAAIDCITFDNAVAEGAATGLRVIGKSAATPGMTLVTAPGNDPAPIRAALAGLPAETAHALRLRGVVDLPGEAYDLPLPPPPAMTAG